MTLWSEENKVYNVLIPVADPWAGSTTGYGVHLENYKRLTYIIPTGVTTSGAGVVTVNAAASASGAGTAIAFKYRTCSSGGAYGTLTDSTGLTMTMQREGMSYIIDVDVSDIAAAGTDYDYSTLTVTEGAQDTPAVVACVLAILSEPRYPQGTLQHTALTY